MLIDWFTVVAQVINFLVLVWLLKRFLYKPVIRAMDERERRIARRLEQADHSKEEARQELERYETKNRALDSQREALISQMREGVEAERKRLMSHARSQVDAVRANWYEALEREEQAFLQELRQRASRQALAIARRAFKDLANVVLERHVVQVFIEHLRRLDDGEQAALRESVKKSKAGITVRSAFELSDEVSGEIRRALREQIGAPFDLHFETNSDVVCGIELLAQGRKIAWSLGEYLQGLETTLSDLLTADRRGGGRQESS